eukprot:Platyproteum_vivax@DN6587_c0_g1_i1.p1
MLKLSRASLLRCSPVVLSGGRVQPGWSVTLKGYKRRCAKLSPGIPDKDFYGEHQNYTVISLWLYQNIRPVMWKVKEDLEETAVRVVKRCEPVTAQLNKQCPGFLHKVVLVFAAFVAFRQCVMWYDYLISTKAQTVLNTARERVVQKLDRDLFFGTAADHLAEDTALLEYSQAQLSQLWEESLEAATLSRSFDVLAEAIEPEDAEVPDILPRKMKWRFDMIPYGPDNPDTAIFQPIYSEKRKSHKEWRYLPPHDFGDYINRKDNKIPYHRPLRAAFSTYYMG